MRIGIIGCGAIAREVAKYRKIDAAYDLHPDRCGGIAKVICRDIDELLSHSDIVIEAASTSAVVDYAEKILLSGKDMIVMSVGAFADNRFRDRIFSLAKELNRKIYLPSGAIGGIDLIRAARVAGIDEVKIITIKNPNTLGIKCNEKTKIFEGTAEEAIARFPKSTNVTVLLSIVSGVKVKVEVYADPDVESNIHQILVRGKFGEMKMEIRNRRSDINPRTSYLASLSPISVLDLIESNVVEV